MKNRTGRWAAKKFTQRQVRFDLTKKPDFQLRQVFVNANAALEEAEAEEKARPEITRSDQARRCRQSCRSNLQSRKNGKERRGQWRQDRKGSQIRYQDSEVNATYLTLQLSCEPLSNNILDSSMLSKPSKSHPVSILYAELRPLRKEHGSKSILEAAKLRSE